MQARKAAEHLRQEDFAEVFLQTQTHLTTEPAAVQRGAGLVIEGQQASGVSQHQLAAVGQRQAAPRATQQQGIGLTLELAQLCAGGRGRAPQALRGASEAAQFDPGNEGAQGVHVEVGQAHDTPVFWNQQLEIIRFSARILSRTLPDLKREASGLRMCSENRS